MKHTKQTAKTGTFACLTCTFAILLLSAGCGKGSSSIPITSAAFNASAAATARTSASTMAVSGITDISFCIRDIKVETVDGASIKNSDQKSEDSEDWIKYRVGLVSLADGKKSVSWGSAALPVGEPVKRVKIKIHKDKSLCNVDYSVKINDHMISRDIELHFSFAEPKDLAAGDTITLDVATIVAKLKDAYDRQFNEEQVEQALGSTEGVASTQ